MPIEIIGMVGTREASEIKGPLVDGPVVDWMDGPVIDPDYLVDISRAHEDAGFDRVLIGYGAVAPEGWMIATTVLHSTTHLKVLVAHRPGFVQPVLLARMAATLDHLTGGGQARHPLHHRRRRGGSAPGGRLRGPRRPLSPHRRSDDGAAADLVRGRAF